ncbi:hypothetical protein WICPIJ_003483 [Wickerhamomyces pijperi]|uniref:Uncharacterized protein n=1 Tax=Wickerhamomyces pijperi TaxID=599730 RepID=A0A9P8Q9L1_WICPI|nr:hypothetical protein WICPIJ_003483 [Wickerhamomyces pijperi]
MTWTSSTSSTGSLTSRSLTDPIDLKRLNAVVLIVLTLLGSPTINDVTDTWDGQREDQNPTFRQFSVDLASFSESFIDVIGLGGLVEMHRDWILSSLDLQNRRRNLEQCGVLCEIRDSQQHTYQDVGIDTSFVGFIDDNGTVLLHDKVCGHFSQQNTVSHELQLRTLVNVGVETDLMRHFITMVTHFHRHSFGHGHSGNTTRLSDTDHQLGIISFNASSISGRLATMLSDSEDERPSNLRICSAAQFLKDSALRECSNLERRSTSSSSESSSSASSSEDSSSWSSSSSSSSELSSFSSRLASVAAVSASTSSSSSSSSSSLSLSKSASSSISALPLANSFSMTRDLHV